MSFFYFIKGFLIKNYKEIRKWCLLFIIIFCFLFLYNFIMENKQIFETPPKLDSVWDLFPSKYREIIKVNFDKNEYIIWFHELWISEAGYKNVSCVNVNGTVDHTIFQVNDSTFDWYERVMKEKGNRDNVEYAVKVVKWYLNYLVSNVTKNPYLILIYYKNGVFRKSYNAELIKLCDSIWLKVLLYKDKKYKEGVFDGVFFIWHNYE